MSVAAMNQKKSEKGFADEQAISATQETHLLIDDPVRGWRPMSMNRGLAAQRGELCLPSLARHTVRVALCHIEMSGGRAAKLARVELSQWTFDATGRISKPALFKRLRQKLDGVASEDGSQTLSAHDLKEIARCLSLPSVPG